MRSVAREVRRRAKSRSPMIHRVRDLYGAATREVSNGDADRTGYLCTMLAEVV